ncbi:hypothetical protein [Streptomyces sp. NPDC029674]|uniref:golvesin C-terminal-like domain-containing protein n=1 Tax=Streptomyces sp. NPDC029674 TaxID=3365297 RepID=UPI00384A47BC
MRIGRRARAPLAAIAAGAVLGGMLQGAAWADDPPEAPVGRKATMPKPAKEQPDTVPPGDRKSLLGGDYKKSGDRAWATTSDAHGFHLLTAREKDGYAWKTTASLSEPGFDTDAWIGNACVTGSGKRAVVVYAPRTFTNKPELMARGAFAAVVQLETGAVTKLPLQVSLSYYNPGCGVGESAVLTQSGGEEKGATRLTRLDAVTGKLSKPVETKGQVTSAVAAKGGAIMAAAGAQVVRVDGDGKQTPLVRTDAVPYRLTPDADGGLVFLDRQRAHGKNTAADKGRSEAPGSRTTAMTRVKRITAGQAGTPRLAKNRAKVLATGPLTETGLTRGGGTVYVTGKTRPSAKLPGTVRRLAGTPKDALVSTRGQAVLTETAWTDGQGTLIRADAAAGPRPVNVKLTALDSGKKVAFTVEPGKRRALFSAQGNERTPALPHGKARRGGKAANSAGLRAGVSGRNEIVESERVCSVPRNDPRNQATQPKPRQVEWAVNQAVRGNLDKHASRPANWKNLGMPAYRPQTLFPKPTLEGGGNVPAQVMLGVTTQESNMWQAARSTVPGVTGNPLIGNYYGIDYYDGNPDNDWDVNWNGADCGYGITQVTDHMRMAGREHGKGGTAWPYEKQRAVALDYSANVAAGLQILASKWNDTRKAGLKVNDGDSAKLENWSFALWAYNAGFHPNKNDGKPWGVGWANNPANPEWDAGRDSFMEKSNGDEDASDAAHPQDWPYQEKVLGFAAHPPAFMEAPGTMVPAFRAAWWNGTEGSAQVEGSAKYNRARVKPPEDTFCTSANDCDPGKIGDGAKNEDGAGPCKRGDFKCWWNKSVKWKDKCDYSCGNDFTRFPVDWAEEPDGTAYPPNCTTTGLPANALIVDDLPAGTTPVRSGCSMPPLANNGSFSLDFVTEEAGLGHDGTTLVPVWPAKVDLHQLGAGFGAHFYFGHTRQNDQKGNRLKFTGTWKFTKDIKGPAKVMVHLPDHGAHTAYAKYEIETAKGTRTRIIDQKNMGGGGKNRWVNLGAYMFDGAPKVRLSTTTRNGTGDEDIAFDAIAVAPIKGKYTEHTVDAVGLFDENQNIDGDEKSSWIVSSPFETRQKLYDWGHKLASDTASIKDCEGTDLYASCLAPKTKAVMERWKTEIERAGTDPVNHPDGSSLARWIGFANSYKDRPTSATKPSHFDTDDGRYKIRSKAKVSFVVGEDGKIVDGSQAVQYDNRTGDTHLPPYLMEFFTALHQDYGIEPPDLTYTTKDLNEHDGRNSTADPTKTGVMPGRAYAFAGRAPELTDNNTCVAALYTSGGSIGYRPMIGAKSASKAMDRWQQRVYDDKRLSPWVVKIATESFQALFNTGGATGPVTGSIFGQAPPIWQELNFKACADGSIKKRGDSPVLRSSHMPNQYLYHNNQAMDLDGRPRDSKEPVITGDFVRFSRAPDPGSGAPLWANPFGSCTSNSGHSGNPWGITSVPPSDPGMNPKRAYFCADKDLEGAPEHSS